MKKLFLYLSKNETDVFVGTLYFNVDKGVEVPYFEYSESFIKNGVNVLIDPLLYLYRGPQYNFGFINDMVPDRFGSLLINKIEQDNAIKENRAPRKLFLSDYLSLVNDSGRMGALRIKEDMNGEFVNQSNNSIPPYIYLRDIEEASIQLEKEGAIDGDVYRRLLLPGSSLGGARPKANIWFNDEIYLAKFPSNKDTYDVELWEFILNQIANELGMRTIESKIEQYSELGHTVLFKRFDREHGKRIHYISAVTALGTTDGNSGKYSYLDLVSFIMSHCCDINNELLELYKRAVFTYITNNTDNHLRNHAFIYSEKGLILSPMYDVNPSFFKSDFELPFGFGNNKEGLFLLADHCHIDNETASIIYESYRNTILERIDKYGKQFPIIKDGIL